MFWRARLLSGREGAPPALRISSATLASDSVGRARTAPLSFSLSLIRCRFVLFCFSFLWRFDGVILAHPCATRCTERIEGPGDFDFVAPLILLLLLLLRAVGAAMMMPITTIIKSRINHLTYG